jgi:DNA-binding NarL/FixJ family response regulator
MLSGEPDIEIVAEASDGQQLLEQLDAYDGAVDVVLLDVRMPGLSGLDVLERLGGTGPLPDKPAVVILSMYSEPAVVRRAVELGAAGYLLKNTTRDQLLAALRHVAAGNCFVQADITRPLLDHVAGRDRLEELPKLTERELQVLDLVAAGQANKQIATELGLSEATIKTHLKAIFARLHAANRAEAAAKALQLGLIGDT